MNRWITSLGLLLAVVSPCCAQEWTVNDSIRLQRLMEGEQELKLNPKALEELQRSFSPESPEMANEKRWLDFDTSLPEQPEETGQSVRLTLHPYTTRTRYDWDPVYQKKITVNKDTWRGPFHHLKSLIIPTNWAKRPLDAGPRETLEQIEATGLRYMVTERANGMAVGSWQGVGGGAGGGMDLMTPFTRDFWNFKGRKRRARTLEVLRAYGDSVTAFRREDLK